VIRGPAGCGGLRVLEVQLGQVQLINKGIDDADRVVLADEVVKTFGKQDSLASVVTLDVSRHAGSCARYAYEL
jgi:hypothetical protein